MPELPDSLGKVLFLDLIVSYTQTRRERRATVNASPFGQLSMFALPGGVLMLVGFGLLSKAAASTASTNAGYGALAGLIGLAWLLIPHYKIVVGLRRARELLGPELHVQISDTGLRYTRSGVSLTVDWVAVQRITEHPECWGFRFSGGVFLLPKRAVPEADHEHLSLFLRDRVLEHHQANR
jgi:YcxB-like protein